MKRKSGPKSESENINRHESEERRKDIHEIRKKIENMLLEREQKKLWEL
ncbi:hypothetical protein [Vibrio sagamiensis]|uniref:Uncharacterized protein n=1 Tax=Vibrio sagamiensis NBRC 104589 TaxID=1219064 RepID=A0A511QEV6_9VIBR|nr:hypothetical protein [Vibrio sagamiensis]GEM75831.1 hypothetical protein VSA01S_19430 [Vibrio sagamiensis NBRC 104589]